MSENRATDERPPFILIEEAVVDDYNLHPMAGWLYVVIVRHINRKKNDAFPSIARLAKLARMSRASVIRYTKVLEDAGLIRVERDKDESGENLVNHYRLPSASKVVSQRDKVVSDSNHPSITQKPEVVSDSDTNQKNINQKNINQKGKTPSAPKKVATPVSVFNGVSKRDCLDIAHAWAENLSAPPIGAYSDRNLYTAAEIFNAGYRATQVAMFVREKKAAGWWKDKTLNLAKVAELLPEYVQNLKPRYSQNGSEATDDGLVPDEWDATSGLRILPKVGVG